MDNTKATFSVERLRQFARELHNAAHNNQTREPDPYGEALDWSADEIERLLAIEKRAIEEANDSAFTRRARVGKYILHGGPRA